MPKAEDQGSAAQPVPDEEVLEQVLVLQAHLEAWKLEMWIQIPRRRWLPTR
jgi:hypothetical protein